MLNSETNANLIPEEVVLNKIYFIRNHKVMLDKDLAELYGVETRVLNQAIKRNLERFPDDFMFQLSQEEFNNLISQSVTSSWGGTRKTPYAFTFLKTFFILFLLYSKTIDYMVFVFLCFPCFSPYTIIFLQLFSPCPVPLPKQCLGHMQIPSNFSLLEFQKYSNLTP